MSRLTFRQEGSTFLTVLIAIVMLTLLLTSFFGLTIQQIMYSHQLKNNEQALSNARSGYVAAYHELHALWSTATAKNFSLSFDVARTTLLSVEASWIAWANTLNTTQHFFHLTITYGPSSFTSNSSSLVFDQMELQSTGFSGNLSSTLKGAVLFSGMLPMSSDAIYTTGDLHISGGLKIVGNVAVGGSLILHQSDSSDFPYLSAPYTLAVARDIGLWGKSGILPIAPSNISSYFSGVSHVGVFSSTLQPSFSAILKQGAFEIQKQKNALYLGRPRELSPNMRGFVHVTKSGVTTHARNFIVKNPLFIQGNFIIKRGTTLTLLQPMYVSGNLTVYGKIYGDSAIFVNGRSEFFNLSQSEGDQGDGMRFELFSYGPITLSQGRQKGNEQYSPTRMNAYLESASKVSLSNMTGGFYLSGGIEAQSVSIDASVVNHPKIHPGDGDLQFNSTRATDLTKNVTIAFDNRFFTNPVTGNPTFPDLVLQPMAQPALLP
ncbi:type IV pilus modification PilV family protein [Ferroacidibacillus organovorans]|uniref:Uncharacterized protein n=1 Tax=Ferroacidibacillus organovorans TaxID=1765683 RepID=A0A117SYC5_9BACL|nr:hypothetical protein [Ferroacidibacillus organovorans]KUO96738.1 hypothetical protein ATW55_07915 [Ferroacidibacillus organovorans]